MKPAGHRTGAACRCRKGRRLVLRLSLAVSLAALCLDAVAGDNGPTLNVSADMIAKGRSLAAAHCGVCHAIGPDDESPAWANSNASFRMLYERYPIPMLEEALATGRVSGHDEMPEFNFSLDDAKALLAYIDSLAPDKPGYVSRTDQR